ncbi:MAG: hypothetical protein CL943_02025 [Candidatus Diapherotrites archaeon]|uniref:Uncharacterized protein n=1 Tax=Candidatus Iainarchaeum sp. TaxID=3101447 RepID=A0A2D6M0W7_9ARCH|nr:hypothetical protein [Candidatus Diapherotrites archaeon]
MNERGNLLLFIFIAFVILALIPPIIMYFFPAANIIMRIILALIIIMMIRGYLGNSVLTLLVSGILIYFLVIKWAYFTASVYVFYFLSGIAFFSVIIWGVGSNMKK